jgi:hypothetical protein
MASLLEESMFASIRSYDFESTPSAADLAKLTSQIEHDFVGQIEHLPGFHGYYMCNIEGQRLLTISLFETKASATESTRLAADFTKNNKLAVSVGPMDLAEGDVLVAREAPREVGAH